MPISYPIIYHIISINDLEARKAPRPDNITAEEIQEAAQGSGLNIFHKFCCRIWNGEIFPDEWKKAVNTLSYVRKTRQTMATKKE